MKEFDLRLVLVLMVMSARSTNTQSHATSNPGARRGFKLYAGKVWSDKQCDLITFYASDDPDDCIRECSYYSDCTAFNYIGSGCVLRDCPLPIPEPENADVDYFKGYYLDQDNFDQSGTIYVSNNQQNTISQSVPHTTSAPISQVVEISPTNRPGSVAHSSQSITVTPTNHPIVVAPTSQPIVLAPITQSIPVTPIIQPIAFYPDDQSTPVAPIIEPIAFYPGNRTSKVVEDPVREFEILQEQVQNDINNTLVEALHAAAKANLPEVVHALLNAGIDKDTRDGEGMTPLYVASWFGSLPVVQKLIEHDADVNIQANNGSTPLMVATWKGNINIVKALLDANANTELANLNGETVLHNSAAFNRPNIATLILQKGVDTMKQDKWGFTPEELARDQGSLRVADIIKDFSSTSGTNNQTTISSTHIPSSDNHNSQSSTSATVSQTTMVILPNKSDTDNSESSTSATVSQTTMVILPNKSDTDNSESSTSATISQTTVVPQLSTNAPENKPKMLISPIQSNIDNIQSSTSAPLSQTTLVSPSNQPTTSNIHRSITFSQSRVAIHSNKSSTPISQSSTSAPISQTIMVIPSNQSTTVIENDEHELWNASSKGDLAFVYNTVKSGANLNWKNPSQHNSTALHAASKGNYTEIVSVLLEAGADKDTVNDKGMTPLYLASLSGNTNVVNKLLEYDVDVDLQANIGSTPLMAATWQGHLDVVKALLGANANTSIMNVHNETALHNAAAYNRADIARILLEEGAETSGEEQWRLTPEELAKERGNSQVESLIKNFASIHNRKNISTAEGI